MIEASVVKGLIILYLFNYNSIDPQITLLPLGNIEIKIMQAKKIPGSRQLSLQWRIQVLVEKSKMERFTKIVVKWSIFDI